MPPNPLTLNDSLLSSIHSALNLITESLFRVIGVLILAYFANRFRIKKLNWTEQLIMMYGGLRGGVAFALVLLLEESFAPNAKMFVTTTLAMVYWTVFVQVKSHVDVD